MTMKMVCKDCGMEVSAIAYLTQDGCTQTMAFTYEFKINGEVILDNAGYEDSYTSHKTIGQATIELKEYGACGGKLVVYKCGDCGAITEVEDFELGCKIDMEKEPEPEMVTDKNGVVHAIQKVQCPNCGLEIVVDTWVEQESECVSITYMSMMIRIGETVIVELTDEYWNSTHNYEYTYEFLGEEGNCEAGVKVTEYCTICGDSYSYTSHGHGKTERSEEVNFSEYGMCGGTCEVERCKICKTITYVYENSYCNWQFVDKTEDGYQVFECSTCKATKVVYTYDSEKDENCQYYHTETRIYLVKGEEVYRYESSYTGERHNYKYDYQLYGESCDDGYLVITTCENCDIYWTSEGRGHERREQYVKLNDYGACYGELNYSSCLCGQNVEVYLGDSCAYNYTESRDQDENGNWIYVEVNSCPECGLRYERSYYVVEDYENCTSTYYYTIMVTVGETLVMEKEYVEVRETHIGKTTGTLLNGESCEDGIEISFKCDYCDYGYSYTTYGHHMFQTESFNLSELGSVCGGYAVLSECACGRYRNLSLEECLCDRDSESCELWIENALTGYQYNYFNENYWYDYNACVYTCAVTDPACGYKIRYASYYLKSEGDCYAYQYETWQFGYDDKTGACLYELTFKTGNRQIHHNYKEEIKDNYTKYECVDCGTYCVENRSYNEENGTNRYEIEVSITLEDVYFNYYQRITESYNEYYYEYVKCGYSDGTEWWSEDYRNEEVYNGPFGDSGYKVTRSYSNSNGENYEQEYAYVVYDYYDYKIYEYKNEGDSWYRYDYSYNFDDVCTVTIVYTDSEKKDYTQQENVCHFTRGVLIKAPTCSQDGIQCWECGVCKNQGEYSVVSASDHKWTYDGESGYYCDFCGLENANGASGDIIMEDLTMQYGDGEYYVVGYCICSEIKFLSYVSLVLESGEDIFVDVEVVEMDGVRAYKFSKSAVETFATENGYTDYEIRFTFVPYGVEGSFDYGLTFTA